ncbi:peptidyl-tRNA hydrolase [Desulfuromonas versatilis]|uniref:Peptidyl-tRNA hydrolase n=1 Tax=Desulfuromonas versatilis TaxID=2802975 RepID=A0ABN6E426_9BACT|nr:aminoacyl-tRNA hydrolase [Desulfuromonas versatilis]BCR05921.1 peptidyl-tRNA hydrolase [Desulfuromonas versatilis]
MKLVVGLGNPGPKYADTRHNIGFMAVQRLAEATRIALKKQGHQGLYGVGSIDGQQATLLLPQTFMNRSGVSVASASRALSVTPGDLLVVHDDIDLSFGVVKIRVGGGHGGHNGIRSIHEVLGSGDFVRLKVGVGRPPAGGDVAGYVLNPFAAAEKKALDSLLVNLVRVMQAVLGKGALEAMNEFNNRDMTQ